MILTQRFGSALWALLVVLLFGLAQSAASEPFLSWPLDCEPGQTCVIEDYVDIDPSPNDLDYRCGLKSRDAHRGTDISIITFEAMEQGVTVLAAASGIVDALRDGLADAPLSPETRAALQGRECGNAVRIKHANGFQTLYCHMKNGSLRVRQGQHVEAGTPLGDVGLSGWTNNPHLHLSVLDENGHVVDPFAPNASPTRCDAGNESLWIAPVAYTPTGLFTAGFSNSVPEFAAVQDGSARRTVLGTADALVLYAFAFEAQPGDRLALEIRRGTTQLLVQENILANPRRTLFQAHGLRAPDGGWPVGAYRGYVRLWRGEVLIATRHADVTVR